MAHLDTAYKLGALKAAEDFEAWLQSIEHDNPTEAPPKLASAADIAVAQVLEKLGEPRGKKVRAGSRVGGKSQPASRAPLGSGGRFKALKRKLSKKKGVQNPDALAAAIGRSAHGRKGMARLSSRGRK